VVKLFVILQHTNVLLLAHQIKIVVLVRIVTKMEDVLFVTVMLIVQRMMVLHLLVKIQNVNLVFALIHLHVPQTPPTMLLAKLTQEMQIVRKIKVAKPVQEMPIVVNLMVEVFQINQDVTPEPEFADLVPSMPIVLPVHRTVEKWRLLFM